MAEFKNKEEYEQWKKEREKSLIEMPAEIKKPSLSTDKSETLITNTLKKSKGIKPIIWLYCCIGIGGILLLIYKPALFIVGLLVVSIVSFFVWINMKNTKFISSLNSSARFTVGKYLFGLSNNEPVDNAEVYINDTHFIFVETGIITKELGRIVRNSINKIDICDKSQIAHSALNPAGFLVGGTVGALSATTGKKIKHEEFAVLIDWTSEKGLQTSTVFQFEGKNSVKNANTVANNLKKYVKERALSLGENERKCPYCAETIKAEAKVCRFCNKEI
jgi:hypothetical protein